MRVIRHPWKCSFMQLLFHSSAQILAKQKKNVIYLLCNRISKVFIFISTTDKRLHKKNSYQHSAQIIMAECAHETPYDNPDLIGKYKSTVSYKMLPY